MTVVSLCALVNGGRQHLFFFVRVLDDACHFFFGFRRWVKYYSDPERGLRLIAYVLMLAQSKLENSHRFARHKKKKRNSHRSLVIKLNQTTRIIRLS